MGRQTARSPFPSGLQDVLWLGTPIAGGDFDPGANADNFTTTTPKNIFFR